MSLKTAFAAVLKATRSARGLSQKNLAEVSSRTYVSKLERGQSSPTLEMVTALSAPLNLSPLTLVAITIGAQTGHTIKSLIARMEDEVSELSGIGVLKELQMQHGELQLSSGANKQSKSKKPFSTAQQAEFCFAD